MNLAQVLAFPAVQGPQPLGPIVTAQCEARHCPDRSAPVFLVHGTAGYQALCETCRDYQRRIVRVNLPLIRQGWEHGR